MKCPRCDNRAISFYDWAKGLRWYKTGCDSCGTVLKANIATILGFILSIGLGIGTMAFCKFGLEVKNDAVTIVLGFVLFIAGGILTWVFGGYFDPVAYQEQKDELAGGPYSKLVSLGKKLFLICIGALVIGRVLKRFLFKSGSGLTPEVMMILIPIWTIGIVGLLLMLVGWLGNKFSARGG